MVWFDLHLTEFKQHSSHQDSLVKCIMSSKAAWWDLQFKAELVLGGMHTWDTFWYSWKFAAVFYAFLFFNLFFLRGQQQLTRKQPIMPLPRIHQLHLLACKGPFWHSHFKICYFLNTSLCAYPLCRQVFLATTMSFPMVRDDTTKTKVTPNGRENRIFEKAFFKKLIFKGMLLNWVSWVHIWIDHTVAVV